MRILPAGIQEVIDLPRKECFVILACMFLGILPRQMHEDLVHFGQLMTIREGDTKAFPRQEKLKCIMAYFKGVARDPGLLRGSIRLQRTKNTNTDFMDYLKSDREVPLRAVEVTSIDQKAIEDYCGKGIMVDFANKKLGGGVLSNGCVQEEVLFSIFPEAIVSKILCEHLEDSEALIIYGVRRFSNYRGYADTFEYQPLRKLESEEEAAKSILVAIDATNFSQFPAPNYQYSKKCVRREINKAVTGFTGAGLDAGDDMPVVTGRWGCGAFAGDEQLKFLIQWVAASEANREMVYITTPEKVREFRLLVRELQELWLLDIVGILDEYYRSRTSLKEPISVLEYIKEYAR